MVRDKQETKARILTAVGKLLSESGFQQLGINAIAREAGVDKVLIYRYFDNLPTLLRTFAKEGNYWLTVEELVGDQSAIATDALDEWMHLLLVRFLHDLQERTVTQEILRWELLAGNELTQELAQVRDRMAMESLKFLDETCSFPPDKDIHAISAVLIAGIVYLVLRTKASSSFLGIDFSSVAGWQRIEAALSSLVEAAVRPNEASSSTN